MREVAVLRKQMREHRTRDVLSKLAKLKKKSKFLAESEKAFSIELTTHMRGWQIDEWLDILETELMSVD